MTVGTDGLRAELVGLLDDFKALALADVTIKAMTVRRFTESRRLVPEEALRAFKRSVFSKHENPIVSMSNGVDIASRDPRSIEECESAGVWYSVLSGEPVVNANGELWVVEPGWNTHHDIAYSGANASQVKEVIDAANRWALRRLRWVAGLLWPGRSIQTLAAFIWLDVIDAVAELAGDATLERAEWCVEVGPYAASFPVSMWKSRKDWAFATDYSPEDELRIGEDPEVVFRVRDGMLKDSMRVIQWLLKKVDEIETSIAERKLVEVRTAGDLWKALEEQRTPAVTVSAISIGGGANTPRRSFPIPIDQQRWDTLDRALAHVDAEGDRSKAMPKLIAQVALKLNVNRQDVINMPLGEFVDVLSAKMPDAEQLTGDTTIAREALRAVVDGGLSAVLGSAGGLSASERVSETMLNMLAADVDRYSWSADRWVIELGKCKINVSKPTIIGNKKKGVPACRAWEAIMAWRASNKRARPVSEKTG